jgi:predicted Fe-Mo cluster-binding NifX family protein
MEYKIAVTTTSGGAVDLHFGQAGYFSIYTVDSESGKYTFLEKRTIEEAGFPDDNQPQSNHGCSCNGARVEYIAGLLSGCTYLLTGKIGNRPHSILLSYGISALETPYPLEYAVKKLNDYKKQHQQKV